MKIADPASSLRWVAQASVAVCLASASMARADHGVDPADELPLSLMIAVAVVVALAALIVHRIRNSKKRRATERADELP